MAEGIQGEPVTGYAPPENGPFRCGNCEYFSHGACGQSVMRASSKRPKTADGFVKVDTNGCCTYFHSADAKNFKRMAVKRRMR